MFNGYPLYTGRPDPGEASSAISREVLMPVIEQDTQNLNDPKSFGFRNRYSWSASVAARHIRCRRH